jgi:hypothetical protein
LTSEDKAKSVALEEVEARMRPGNFSQAGFLGPEESLRQVLELDARTLEELGVTADDLGDRLGQLLESAIASTRTQTRAGPYRIRLQRYKGPQICPFAPEPHENPCPGRGDKRLASIDWSISDARNGAQLSGPGLIVHLISAHGFFEGLHSPYRVAPRKLAEFLKLGSFSSLKH